MRKLDFHVVLKVITLGLAVIGFYFVPWACMVLLVSLLIGELLRELLVPKTAVSAPNDKIKALEHSVSDLESQVQKLQMVAGFQNNE